MRFYLGINYFKRLLSVFYRSLSVLGVFYAFYPFFIRSVGVFSGTVGHAASYCFHTIQRRRREGTVRDVAHVFFGGDW